MRMRTVAGAVSATLAATLLLSACGGGGKSDHIKGAKGDDKSSTSASPSVSPSSEKGAPTFDFPKDVHIKIDPDTTGNKTKDAVLRDNGYAIDAIDLALAKGDPTLPVFTDYVSEEALSGWSSSIKDYRKQGYVITGKVHYYARSVKLGSKSTAGATYCEDDRYGYDKKIKTGKVEKTAPDAKSFIYHVDFLRKNSKGTWQTARDQQFVGAKTCRR